MMLHPSIFLVLAMFTPFTPTQPVERVECSCICWTVEPGETHPPPPGEHADELAEHPAPPIEPGSLGDWPQPYEPEHDHGPCPPSAP